MVVAGCQLHNHGLPEITHCTSVASTNRYMSFLFFNSHFNCTYKHSHFITFTREKCKKKWQTVAGGQTDEQTTGNKTNLNNVKCHFKANADENDKQWTLNGVHGGQITHFQVDHLTRCWRIRVLASVQHRYAVLPYLFLQKSYAHAYA